MSRGSVLVVEDDADLREALEDTLTASDFTVATASDGAQALLRLASDAVDVVVSDVQMSPVDGWELLDDLRRDWPSLPVVLMTAYGSIDQAVKAIHRGAVDYLAKPFDADELVGAVVKHLPPPTDSGIVAEDRRTIELLDLARRVADSDLTVMLAGESGSGKEVIARYIHRHSARRDGPYVAINCAAIPENMLEAVLFGYERGAFTGAHTSHEGKFEQAQGGTLLLDEISEMGPALQAKLLRVLQERELERLGGKRTIALDVRVYATTNRNLREEVEAQRFRADLYYRLNVLPLSVPPLRERPDDIIPLAAQVLGTSVGSGKTLKRLSSAAKDALVAHSWPGNVRELHNLVQRAMVLAGGDVIEVEHLQFDEPQRARVEVDLPENLEADLKAREREVIFSALRQTGRSREAAAARLGISPRTLRHKLARLRDEGEQIPGEQASGNAM